MLTVRCPTAATARCLVTLGTLSDEKIKAKIGSPWVGSLKINPRQPKSSAVAVKSALTVVVNAPRHTTYVPDSGAFASIVCPQATCSVLCQGGGACYGARVDASDVPATARFDWHCGLNDGLALDCSPTISKAKGKNKNAILPTQMTCPSDASGLVCQIGPDVVCSSSGGVVAVKQLDVRSGMTVFCVPGNPTQACVTVR